MSRLRAAKDWYDQQLAWLDAVDSWIRAGKKQPEDTSLRDVMMEYASLKDRDARERLRVRREDAQRMALIRLFAGFEADFKRIFVTFLVHRHEGSIPGNVRDALPKSIAVMLVIARSLEPRFSGSDKGWVDGLQGFRNDIMHGGFENLPVKYDPSEAYEKLDAILKLFEPTPP